MNKTAPTALESQISRWDQDKGRADVAGPEPGSRTNLSSGYIERFLLFTVIRN